MAINFPTVAWAASTNIYEVNIRQYTSEGTFNAFAQHLPRLKQMGVEVLWFMPIFPISTLKRQGTLGSYYACSSYKLVNPEFGSREDFGALVHQAHALGMKVMLDWVANHTGWDHEWTVANPSFYKTDSAGNFYDSNGWVDVIDLDYSNAKMRQAMVKAMQYWVEEFDIDGYRCDMAHLVPLDFWDEARAAIEPQKELLWLAETEDPTYHKVFDVTFTWKFLHLLEDIYTGKSSAANLLQLMEAYATDFPADALRLYFITNHDENSHSGSEFERLGHAVRAFAVLCCTMPNSIPLLYSGQEIPNKKRLLFFDKDSIDWNGQCLLSEFYNTLFHLRKSNSALWADNNTEEILVENTDEHKVVLGYLRKNDKDAVLVLINLSVKPMIKFRLADLVETGSYRSMWSGLTIEIDDETNFELQAWEYLVYEKVNE